MSKGETKSKHGTMARYTSQKSPCRCPECSAAVVEYQRQRRLKRPDVREKDRKHSQRYRETIAKHVRKLKDGICTDCGIKYPYYVMHFDHLDGELKSAGIAQLRSIALIDEEVKKCELVCANCHAERTHRRRLDKLS